MTSLMLRAAAWVGVVSGCAFPLARFAVQNMDDGGRSGMLVGIVAWIVAVLAFDARLRRRGTVGRSNAFLLGAALVMAVQGVLALILPREGLPLLYAPAVWLAAKLIPSDPTDFYAHLVLTLMCGGEVAAVAFFSGLGVQRFRRRTMATAVVLVASLCAATGTRAASAQNADRRQERVNAAVARVYDTAHAHVTINGIDSGIYVIS